MRASQRPCGDFRFRNATKAEIAFLIERPTRHILGAVFGDVCGQLVNTILAETELGRVAYVDIGHGPAGPILSNDLRPNTSQEVIALTTMHRDVKVNCAALLLFDHGDIEKLTMLAHAAAEPAPMFQGRIPVDHVLPICQGDHPIRADGLAGLTHPFLGGATGGFVIAFSVL